jgi:hypothetical protein
MVMVMLTGRPVPEARQGPGTVSSVAPNQLWGLLDSRYKLTLQFKLPNAQSARDVNFGAIVSRKEFLEVLDLVDRSARDPDGAVRFDYDKLAERFVTGRGKGKVAPMRACAEKH